MKKTIVMSLLLAVLAAVPVDGASPAKNEQVKIDFYLMSQCPFAVQVDTGIRPVLDKLGDAVQFTRYFIGNEENGAFTSMHGAAEIQGDLLELCAAREFPGRYLDLVACMNRDFRAIPDNFDACAAETKLDGNKIKLCADGEEGKKLLSASFKKAKELGAAGSPTIYINGEQYKGGRSPTAFARRICAAYPAAAAPAYCKTIPPAKRVDLTILNDVRCENCDIEKILESMRNIFPGLAVTVLDYGTPQGKELYEKLLKNDIRLLPVLLFDQNVTAEAEYEQIARWMSDVLGKKMLKMGAKFDPTAEICANNIDDNGNGAVDCDDQTCKNDLSCRTEIPGRLDLFIMSQCPYAIKALNGFKEVVAALGNDIDIHIGYIAEELPGGKFKSLHGQPEVEEDIRELCAMKYYPNKLKYLDYIWCRGGDMTDDWKKCAVGDISAAVIEKCATGGEGKKLLRENIKLAQDLAIGASPTWLANNKRTFTGITAADIGSKYCSHNAGKKACKKGFPATPSKSDDAKAPSCGK